MEIVFYASLLFAFLRNTDGFANTVRHSSTTSIHENVRLRSFPASIPLRRVSLTTRATIEATPFVPVKEGPTEEITSTPNGVKDDKPTEPQRLFEKPFVGLIRDLKARLPFFKSDIKDGLNVQCLAATMFLFFACLAPAIAFGGLFETATAGAIGTVEMVTSTALCGALYALTAAQPITIIGSTGPVLAFIICLAQFARHFSLPFLPLYAWTGLWTSGILGVASVTSASNLVKYLTRFTDEIFSTLISCIFVVEALSDVRGQFLRNSISPALLTVVTASTTFLLASTLKQARRSVYFTRTIRNTISNFAPTIGVVTGTILATWAKRSASIALPALSMPAQFGTTTGRPWLVPLLDLPVWARWASVLPALMATVLLFLDQNITVRLINNKSFKMRKGRKKGNVIDGMHWDMFVLSGLTALQSLFGLPWLVAATVRSLSHSQALAVYDEKDSSKRTGTLEQRVTGFSVHAVMGLAVGLAGPRRLLGQVPMPVLMGLFMYLGISSLPGNEMWERILGVFKDKSAAPRERWSPLPRNVTNLFTAIQVACLVGMFWVKESRIGVLFPVVIAMLAPLRYGLERSNIIPTKYMRVLDKD